jgi:flavin reductase (DIM6/NTAB) family NADH-FMN oxidoreductase RutF
MQIAARDLDADAAYRLLVGIVVPRPIAWITTVAANGLVNAAPFSCYTFVCNDPPMLAVNLGRREGALKDTASNIARSGEFVVNVVREDQVRTMHATSADCPPEQSETELLKLALAPSAMVRPPRLICSPINLECRLERALELGRLHSQLVLGRVVHFHIADEVYDAGKVVVEKLRPLGRLAGLQYARLGETLTMLPAERALAEEVSGNGRG